jgi:hypothetical protein
MVYSQTAETLYSFQTKVFIEIRARSMFLDVVFPTLSPSIMIAMINCLLRLISVADLFDFRPDREQDQNLDQQRNAIYHLCLN